MRTPVEKETSALPVELSIDGMQIGGARLIVDGDRGTFHFAGLDFIARIFFAERIGPGGPGDDTTLADVCVTDRTHRRTMRASQATVRHFSAGTGDLELAAIFAERDL